MEKKKFSYRTTPNMFNELQKQAEEDGISINSWMNMKLKRLIEQEKKKK